MVRFHVKLMGKLDLVPFQFLFVNRIIERVQCTTAMIEKRQDLHQTQEGLESEADPQCRPFRRDKKAPETPRCQPGKRKHKWKEL